MKNLFVFLAVSVLFFSLVSCNKNKSSNEDEDVNYNPALVAKDNLKAYKKAAKLARKQMRDLESQEERTWNYIDTAQALADKEEDSQKKTEKICDENCGGCNKCQNIYIENNINWPAPIVAPRPAVKKPATQKRHTHVCPPEKVCPTCPEIPKPEKVKEPTKVPCKEPCGDKKIFVEGVEYMEYHGNEAPASSPGVIKPGFIYKDSMWWKKL